jgi:hypothetical protein
MGLCETVAGLHANIQAAVIVSRGEVKERFIKQVVPVPLAEALEKLFFRAELFVSMTKESDSLFGKTGYVFTNHDTLDTFIFPVKEGVLIVPIFRPYNHEDLAGLILKVISEHKQYAILNQRMLLGSKCLLHLLQQQLRSIFAE